MSAADKTWIKPRLGMSGFNNNNFKKISCKGKRDFGAVKLVVSGNLLHIAFPYEVAPLA